MLNFNSFLVDKKTVQHQLVRIISNWEKVCVFERNDWIGLLLIFIFT
jgi:hypothetical protein